MFSFCEAWQIQNSRKVHDLRNKWVYLQLPPDHLLLDSAPNLGPLISRWNINKLENCWFKSVRILEVLKLSFQQVLNLSSSQRDMSGPILGDLFDKIDNLLQYLVKVFGDSL